MSITYLINQQVSVSRNNPINALFTRKDILVEPGALLDLGGGFFASLEVDVDVDTGMQAPFLTVFGDNKSADKQCLNCGQRNLPPLGLMVTAKAVDVDEQNKIVGVLFVFQQASKTALLKKRK